jgi:hypothetical protein
MKALTIAKTLKLITWMQGNAQFLKDVYASQVAEAAEAELGFPVSPKSILHLAKNLEMPTRRDLEKAARAKTSEPQLFDGAASMRLDRLERAVVLLAEQLARQDIINTMAISVATFHHASKETP